MIMTTLKSRWQILRRVAEDTRGTEIVESAFVLPLVFMFVIGIIWFGLVFLIYGTLAQGTRAGAEAAVAPVCTTCGATPSPAASAQTAVYIALAAAHLSKSNLVPWGGTSPKWTPPTLCACGSSNRFVRYCGYLRQHRSRTFVSRNPFSCRTRARAERALAAYR